MTRRWKIFTIVGFVTLIADQVTKYWARNTLPSVPGGPGGRMGLRVEVIENFFDWRLSFNPGAAFSMFGNMGGARVFLTVVGLIAIAAIFWMLYKSRDDQTRLIWALGLVVGGAVGNLADRIYFGVVTDFIVWKYYDKEWPTFNIADVALVIGVGLLFIDMIKEARAEARAKAAETDKDGNGGGSGKTRGKKSAA